MPPVFDNQRSREPTGDSHGLPDSAVLENWKDIANHFGVVSRTAQLWERTRGLPVHRKPGPRGRVYAYVEELNAWAARAERGTQTIVDGALPAESTLISAELNRSASDIADTPALSATVEPEPGAEATPEPVASPAADTPFVPAPPRAVEPVLAVPPPPAPSRWRHAVWAILMLIAVGACAWLIAGMGW